MTIGTLCDARDAGTRNLRRDGPHDPWASVDAKLHSVFPTMQRVAASMGTAVQMRRPPPVENPHRHSSVVECRLAYRGAMPAAR
jgi:hypothetical protein